MLSEGIHSTFDVWFILKYSCYLFFAVTITELTTTTPTTTTPTTTTTSTPLPSQCTSSSTRNLTESWRNNSPILSSYHKDTGILDGGRTWFRFTGAAGNLLKNSCPGVHSCGSDGPYWSDSPLPTTIGQTISIDFYERNGGTCKNVHYKGRATRCTKERGGVVYILDSNMNSVGDTLCGMNWHNWF